MQEMAKFFVFVAAMVVAVLTAGALATCPTGLFWIAFMVWIDY